MAAAETAADAAARVAATALHAVPKAEKLACAPLTCLLDSSTSSPNFETLSFAPSKSFFASSNV